MGKTYQETAMILGIKTGTIKYHMSNVVKKLGSRMPDMPCAWGWSCG
ncbi:LuxR C-terminal-related transcriptional regulator [Serratia ureilytica]